VTNNRPNSERQGISTSSTDGMSEQLFPLYLEEARLSAELGPGHPRLKELQRKIQMTRQHLQDIAGLAAAGKDSAAASGGAEGSAELPEEAPAEDFLTVYLKSLEQQLSIIQRQQESVKSLADSEDLLARKLMMEEIEDKNKKAEIDRLSSLFNETTLSISEVQVNAGMGGVTAQVLSKARTGVKISPIMERFLEWAPCSGPSSDSASATSSKWLTVPSASQKTSSENSGCQSWGTSHSSPNSV
jgi:hypothetical protein